MLSMLTGDIRDFIFDFFSLKMVKLEVPIPQ